MKLRTLTNVGPAASMRVTRRPYHHTAPHLSPRYFFSGIPISSMGEQTSTGAKRKNKYIKRVAVRIGSHIRSRISDRNVMIMGWSGSAGDKIGVTVCCEEHGMISGLENKLWYNEVGFGVRNKLAPPAMGNSHNNFHRRRCGGLGLRVK